MTNWYKKANMKVCPEYWKSVGNWVLVPSGKPRDRNLRPLGKSWELGMGQDIFEFNNKEEAEKFARENNYELV